jgi:hypothetical protein
MRIMLQLRSGNFVMGELTVDLVSGIDAIEVRPNPAKFDWPGGKNVWENVVAQALSAHIIIIHEGEDAS